MNWINPTLITSQATLTHVNMTVRWKVDSLMKYTLDMQKKDAFEPNLRIVIMTRNAAVAASINVNLNPKSKHTNALVRSHGSSHGAGAIMLRPMGPSLNR